MTALALRRRRRGTRGFTLVELIVSLVAGLIVAIAMVSLSKEAMNTFHEEARNAAAETALRNGMERLRADIARASFMSTGNILADDGINNQTFGGSILTCSGSVNTVVNYAAAPGIKRLAGVHLYEGAASAASLTIETANGLAPDMIDLGGNFTNGEEYFVKVVVSGDPNIGSATGCGGQILWIQNTTGSAWRLSTGGQAALLAAFHPGAQTAAALPVNTAMKYMVRVGDTSAPMHYQYALLCAAAPISFSAGPPMIATINIDPSTPLAVTDTGKSATCAAATTWNAASGQIRASAVQVVEWDVKPASALPTSYGPVQANDPNELVLTRQYVDGMGVPDTTTLELVAEYVVDLKFAFSVDPTPNSAWPVWPLVGGQVSPGAYLNASGTPIAGPILVHLPFDTMAGMLNQPWAQDVSIPATSANGDPTAGPQRIRSVRTRLVTRTALPDRTQGTAAPAVVAPSFTSSNYLYRYCVGAPATPGTCPADSVTWARAKTDITEVALSNQRQLFY